MILNGWKEIGIRIAEYRPQKISSISVLVFSGEFLPVTPPVVLADRYVQKATQSVPKLKEVVRELVSVSPLRSQPEKAASAPTWLPRSSNGYVVITCPECLRPFSIATAQIELDKPASEQCSHCGQKLTYLIDSTVAATDVVVPPSILRESHQRLRAAKEAIQEAIHTVSNNTGTGAAHESTGSIKSNRSCSFIHRSRLSRSRPGSGAPGATIERDHYRNR